MPLLISYSRSGTNLVSYIIATISSKEVLDGFTKDPNNQIYIVDRAHNGAKRVKHYSKIILLLRNYKECIVRHHGIERINEFQSIKSFLQDKKRQTSLWYANNVISFHKFKGPKIVLYYEDLILQPARSIHKLSTFLDLDMNESKKFIENIDDHYSISLNKYTQKGHKSFTKNFNQAIGIHESKLKDQDKEAFDIFFKNVCGEEVYRQYLIRYETKSF